ncbi:putative ABC transporter, partial [Aureobasidium melanogenum]
MRTLLNQDHLYAIDPELRSRETGQRLEAAFDEESRKIQDRAESSTAPLSVWALPKACFRAVWTDVTAMIPMRLALIGFTFAQPFLFTRAIDYLSQENHDPDNSIGYGLIGATFIIYTGIAISNALYQQQISRIMSKLRGALISMIHDHILVVSDGATKDGAALTLISSDIDTIIRVLGELNESWARLIEVAVGIGLLARQVGA